MMLVTLAFICVVVISIVIKYGKKKRNLPPMCPSSLWSNVFRSGFPSLTHKGMILFLHRVPLSILPCTVAMCEWVANSTDQNIESGAVFRMAMPLPYYFVTCCDHQLGRVLLSGSSDGKVREAEKSPSISNLNMFPGVFNILT
jgi:hypothetical protein